MFWKQSENKIKIRKVKKKKQKNKKKKKKKKKDTKYITENQQNTAIEKKKN
jgi:hypothetical protein